MFTISALKRENEPNICDDYFISNVKQPGLMEQVVDMYERHEA